MSGVSILEIYLQNANDTNGSRESGTFLNKKGG